MAYTTLQRGSRGDTVRQLQDLLNKKGSYGLKSDGIFGNLTERALKDYKTKNSLTGDGIADEATWNILSGTSAATPAPKTAAEQLAALEAGKPTFAPSEGLNAAAAALAAKRGQAPAAYQSPYTAQIQSILDGILNRKDFSYNPTADPLYNQYKDRFQQQGKMAMMDTTAQAAQLSGGYGNSYAATAGNQAYQGALQGMNDVLPQLQQAALSADQNKVNTMSNNLNALNNQDQAAAAANQTNMSNYYNELDALNNAYESGYGKENDVYKTALNSWENDRNYLANKTAEEKAAAAAEAAAKKSGGRGGKPKPKTVGSEYYNGLMADINSGEITTVGMIDTFYREGHITEAQANALEKKLREKTTKEDTNPLHKN